MMNFKFKYFTMVVLSLALLLSYQLISANDDVTEKLQELSVRESSSSPEPSEYVEEDWVNEAVRDVAYYLRSHKFNDFDRRYQTEETAEKIFYRKFPTPALMNLHWEVHKFCSNSFLECLGYLQETALSADLYRSIDTATVINAHSWQLPRNLKSIEQINKECVQLREKDWSQPRIFKGPLERFQWRTTASYFMCWYTMQVRFVCGY
uniref:Uncharacterized protein n=1 Tax=Clastoptera arizonana TaxID=38151 RepID=A0A1B6D1Y1_9HEMI